MYSLYLWCFHSLPFTLTHICTPIHWMLPTMWMFNLLEGRKRRKKRVWHRQSNHKPPTSQLETQPNLMAGLRFNWFTLGQKKKLSCFCRFPWKPINLNGITEYICDFFIHYMLQSDLIRQDQGPEHIVKSLTWRISSWQVFALWHNSCNMTAENLVVSPSYMNKLSQSGTASFLLLL